MLLELGLERRGSWQTPAHHVGDGEAAAGGERARRGSRASSPSGSTAPTTPGRRTSGWVKVKNIRRHERRRSAAGCRARAAARAALGALVVGFYEDGELRYAGRVGTGFTQARARAAGRAARRPRARGQPVLRAPAAARDALRRATARGRGRLHRVHAHQDAAPALLQGPARRRRAGGRHGARGESSRGRTGRRRCGRRRSGDPAPRPGAASPRWSSDRVDAHAGGQRHARDLPLAVGLAGKPAHAPALGMGAVRVGGRSSTRRSGRSIRQGRRGGRAVDRADAGPARGAGRRARGERFASFGDGEHLVELDGEVRRYTGHARSSRRTRSPTSGRPRSGSTGWRSGSRPRRRGRRAGPRAGTARRSDVDAPQRPHAPGRALMEGVVEAVWTTQPERGLAPARPLLHPLGRSLDRLISTEEARSRTASKAAPRRSR